MKKAQSSSKKRTSAKQAPKVTQGSARYPQPGETGGRLIRELIRKLRSEGVVLPIASHILCAISGGSDSVALARMLCRYGRRVGVREKISLLHVNHGWRGEESDRDEAFVRELGDAWGVPVIVHRLNTLPARGESWEDSGRRARKAIFREEAEGRDAVVLTAHTADDLVETVLWRIFTGKLESHGQGILFRHGPEMRPLLSMRKKDLQSFLKEEDQVWREDSSNHEGRFLRSKLRQELLPVVERIFPQAHEHLLQLALTRRDASVRRSPNP